MKAYLIARVSTADQVDALPAQVHRLLDYAKLKDLDFELFQIQESAYSGNREEFRAIIRKVQLSNEPIIIVFDKIDRFSRDSSSEEKAMMTKLLRKGAIELHFPSDYLFVDKNSPAPDMFRLDIGVALGGYYSRAIHDNVTRRFEQMRRDGLWTGKAPFGYRNVDLETGKKWIEIDEFNASAVRAVYEWYASGGYSFKLIRRKLLEDYALTLSNSQLGRILQNPFYKGEMLIKGELYPHKYDRIITEQLYDGVKAVREGFKVKPKRWGGLPYEYRGLIDCGSCGCRITFEKKKGVYVYGHCTQYKGRHGAKYVTQDDCTEQLKTPFTLIMVPENGYQEVNERLKSSFHDDGKTAGNKLILLDTEIKKYESRLDQLYDEHSDHKIPDDFYQRKFKEYSQSQKQLVKQKNTLELPTQNRFESANYLLRVLKNAPILFERANLEQKRFLVNLVLSNLELHDIELRWTLNNPFDEVADCVENQNWLGRRDLFQTFPDELDDGDSFDQDVQEIRQILDEKSKEEPKC